MGNWVRNPEEAIGRIVDAVSTPVKPRFARPGKTQPATPPKQRGAELRRAASEHAEPRHHLRRRASRDPPRRAIG